MQSGADSQKHTLTSVEDKSQDQLNHSSDKQTDAAHFAMRMLYQHKYAHARTHHRALLN